jgi:hypothetical protein
MSPHQGDVRLSGFPTVSHPTMFFRHFQYPKSQNSSFFFHLFFFQRFNYYFYLSSLFFYSFYSYLLDHGVTSSCWGSRHTWDRETETERALNNGWKSSVFGRSRTLNSWNGFLETSWSVGEDHRVCRRRRGTWSSGILGTVGTVGWLLVLSMTEKSCVYLSRSRRFRDFCSFSHGCCCLPSCICDKVTQWLSVCIHIPRGTLVVRWCHSTRGCRRWKREENVSKW